jgi:serine protease
MIPSGRAFVVAALAVASALGAVRASDSVRVKARRAAANPPARQLTDQVIVQFRPEAGEGIERDALYEAGGAVARRSAFGRRYLVTLDAGFTAGEALRRLRDMPEVDYAEPNGIVRAAFTPNDRLYTSQWNLKLLGAERTWDIQKGSGSVVVAVLDTGIAYESFGPYRKAPDWGDTVFVQGYDVVNRDTHPNDDNFHGTHVASTIAEATNNSVGVAGLAFGCALMPVKVLDDEGVGSFFEVAEGVDYAVGYTRDGQKPVKVINLSLGGDGTSETLRRAIDRAVAAGVTVVAAAGNEGTRGISYPASLSNVIAVGAVDPRKRRAPYSNTGPELDVVAPGGDLDMDDDRDGYPDGILQQTFDPDTALETGRYDDFGYFFVEGTSEATPHVSAMAALLVSQGITEPAAVKKVIEETAEDLGAAGRDDSFGFGLIRPSQALKGLGLNR